MAGQALARIPTAAAKAMAEKEEVKKQMSDRQRDDVAAWTPIVRAIDTLVRQGLSQRAAIAQFLESVNAGHTSQDVKMSIHKLGKIPSLQTLQRKHGKFAKKGRGALATNYTGRVRQVYGWEAQAIHLYNLPSKLPMSVVAKELRKAGHQDATESRVRTYLKTLPAQYGEFGKGRMGEKYYKIQKGSYVLRNDDTVPVGFCYMGDGHTLDVYLRHPNGKKIWRAEMTAWLDYRSRYIAGVWITESESGFTTMHSLSHAIIKHNHIPAWIYIDNGSGYKASLMTDEATGFYGRMGISVTNALPGNSKGKGNIERFFRTYEEQMGKTLPGYCGTGMAAEVKSQWVRRANAGKEYVLTIDEWLMKFDEFLNHPTEGYHHSVHSATGKTPAEMWATLDRLPLVTENDPDAAEMALCWPRARVNVRNCMFVLHGRNYKNREALEAYNGQEMHAEYSVHDDSYVRVLDTAGRLVCLADLVQKTPLLPVSRMEEAKQKREAAQIKRLDNKIKEVEMRARDAIPYEQRNATVLDLYGNSKFEEEKKPELLEIEIEKCGEEQGQIEIDPFDTDY